MSDPNSRTMATLDKLDSVEWFASVGRLDQQQVEFLHSWDEAMESCTSSDWESLTLEAANQLRERIRDKSKERLNQWNSILKVVKPFSDALVKDKTKSILENSNLGEEFLKCVRWDIFHLCMEAEYSDIVEPAFFSSLSYYYFYGHFPCGFSGNFPQGRFVIY